MILYQLFNLAWQLLYGIKHGSIPKNKGEYMRDKIQGSGLCFNCLNADNCCYRTLHKRPVIFCEEFTCTTLFDSKKIMPLGIEKPAYSEKKDLTGICSNCDNDETCNLKNIKCNTMNCEEYR